MRPGAGAATLALAATLAMGGCAGSKQPVFEREAFGTTGTYSRSFTASAAQTCEAARRTLLSQGYVIDTASADLVKGHKNFQPEAETHIQIDFNIVCTPEVSGNAHHASKATLAFVNAVQDRYALKKSNNSASVGLSVLGSVSLPFSSSDDSLVKVASETIAASDFYDRFFTLVERYLSLGASATSATAEELPTSLQEALKPVLPAASAASTSTP